MILVERESASRIGSDSISVKLKRVLFARRMTSEPINLEKLQGPRFELVQGEEVS